MIGIDTTSESNAAVESPASGFVPPESSAGRQSLFAVAVILFYLAIGIWAFWPVLPFSSDRLFGISPDSVLATWFFAWVPHALAHGLNPFFSNALDAPSGANLAQNTESPLLGLLTVPFAPFMSAVARGNLVMVLAMPASATSAFLVLRKWKVWGSAAALGGLIYGFSPYAVGQGLGHPVLTFLVVPPLIVLTVVSILQRRGSPRRLGVQLGLLVAAQFLIEPEILTTVAILTAWAMLCLALRYPKRVAETARAVFVPVAIGIGVAVVLLAYPIWFMFRGPQHYKGAAFSVVNPYFNDLFTFITPGPLQRNSLGLHFHGVYMIDGAEYGGYIGIPILLIALALAWRSRHSPRMQLSLAVLAGAAVLSLGSRLVIDGHVTPIRLPFDLFTRIPLLDDILPGRISFEVAGCVAAVIAFGLDDLRHAARQTAGHAHRRGSTAGVRWATTIAVGAAIVVVATQLPHWPYQYQQAGALPAEVTSAIPAGDPVAVTYPYASPWDASAMVWQADAGFPFRLTGGYVVHPDANDQPIVTPSPLNPPGLEQFLEGQSGKEQPPVPRVPVTPALVAETKAAIADHNVGLVIVDRSTPGAAAVMTLFTKVLGPPRVSAGSFSLWATGHSGAFP